MNYRESLKQTINLKTISTLVESILENPSDFEVLFELISDNDEKISWKAAWVCDKIAELRPKFYSQWHIDKIMDGVMTNSQEGFRRSCLSILYHLPLQPINVELLNSCFEWMISTQSSIAVKALSIKIIHRYCSAEPDLKAELKAYLENYDSEGVSAGIMAIKRKVLRTL